MRFQATLEAAGKTATGIRIPADVIEALGSGREPPVRITIGAHTVRTTVATRGDRYLVGVSAENRALAVSRPATRWTSTSSSTPSRARSMCRQTRVTKAIGMLREGRKR